MGIGVTTEANLTRSIQKRLKDTPGWWGFKVLGGQGQRAGIPDIVGCYHGRFMAFEIKTETGRVSPIQAHEIAKIRRAGGEAHVVRSWNDVLLALESVAEEV